MLDDLLDELFSEIDIGRRTTSRRVQLLFRVFFGLLGGVLGVMGAFYIATRDGLGGNLAMRASMIAVFVFLTAFSVFNIALGRRWRWPGILFAVSFVMLFVTRIAFGP